MIFQAEGIVKFNDGLELLDPKMEITNVNYNFKTNKFDLICEFYELHHKHVRSFHNSKTIIGLVKTEDVIEFIQTDEFLNQFTLIPE